MYFVLELEKNVAAQFKSFISLELHLCKKHHCKGNYYITTQHKNKHKDSNADNKWGQTKINQGKSPSIQHVINAL